MIFLKYNFRKPTLHDTAAGRVNNLFLLRGWGNKPPRLPPLYTHLYTFFNG